MAIPIRHSDPENVIAGAHVLRYIFNRGQTQSAAVRPTDQPAFLSEHSMNIVRRENFACTNLS